MAQYGIFFTQLGRDKIASATEGNPLDITHIAVGDGGGGYPSIDDSVTSLVNELGRYPISGTSTPAPTQRQFSAVVPPELGPAVIRERGLIDSEGDLIAIAQAEPIEMPAPGPNAVSVTVGILATFNNADYVRAIVDLQGFVRATRKVTAGIGLKGGGDLTTDVTIDADFALQADAEDEQNLTKVMSPRRTWQAIAKWYDSKFSSFIKTMLGRSSAAQVRNDLQLKSAALRDVGTSAGDVTLVGAFGGFGSAGIEARGAAYDLGEMLAQNMNSSIVFNYNTANRLAHITAGRTYPSGNRLENNDSIHLALSNYEAPDLRAALVRYSKDGVKLDEVLIAHSGNLLDTTGDSENHPMSQKATTDALAEKVSFLDSGDIYIVGPNGDYTSINAALEDLSRRYPPYERGGLNVELILADDYVMEEQVAVVGVDLGWITIRGSTTPNHYTPVLRESINQNFGTGVMPMFFCSNGRFPLIRNASFVMDGSGSAGSRIGILAIRSALISTQGLNFSGDGLGIGAEVRLGSSVELVGSVFKGLTIGINASGGSVVSALGTDCSNAKEIGVICDASTVSANNSNFSGASQYGISVRGGGIVRAVGSTGTLSQVANAITSDGIIFQ